ncbi:DUF2617 family protein (plasmid) [Haloferax mediterranei ATCC 33500]|uniref:DUF2617 family protein n=1 Tax=Haloferax mediterranei (strain ATCC 33500 / DSM 1411 / JCM 8866 / NBRC 14739 / NCIMB 2177 / R-4) TaxID=523841 RepID=I3R9D3_HALMT|nr:DUF2617 family protein [Haloferax mediterranei]AFK20843.1 hypothetical protein HFX_5006 [Haloferax mediterranei ATCC 33500]AHZ24281.1 hypothetical protein BM92_18955 [Haloferax mediterranei ATCC 33500]EMA05365.1 hypothetical protein C439_01160 [Haloferax mediterranei ATCC 33500]MDX5989836.1 DUF2617 family protein [Haloferax mediterranei ATCC 33500]QCQ77279.1 DUF2617 family protein [Haloferax mediterranei ATCC 33500]
MPSPTPPESPTVPHSSETPTAPHSSETPTAPHSSETPTALYFGYTTEVPNLASVEIKTVHPETLLDSPAVFTVIGESHYVGLPALDFHELCSCKPLPSEQTHETPLAVGAEHEFHFESNRLDAQTTVEGKSLDAFPGPDDATVAYRFGPDAWTTIHVASSGDGYETYHTYPEYDLALYTETNLTPTSSGVAGPATETTNQTTKPQR